MHRDPIIVELNKEMQKATDALASELRTIRTGQANTALVEHIKVSYWGTMTPLNQLASIAVPEHRLIVIKPFDPKCLAEIERAILAANIGLTPNNDGKVIRLSIPPLSEENRKQLATKVKEMAEHTRITIRNVRRDTNKKIDHNEKEKLISEDTAFTLKEDIQKELKAFEKKIDEIVEKKTEEILKI